jgi:hypothetical protein
LICRESDKKHQDRKIARRRNEPILEAVRSRLRSAVRTGEIIKPLRCEKCGAEEELHGHHADYTKPLEVTWLCARCHRRAHPERSDALDTLFSRIEAAEAARDKLAERVQQLENLGQELFYREENERLAERVRQLEEALRYYANPENWGNDDWGIKAVCAEYGQSGAIARAALSESSTKMEKRKGLPRDL